MRIEDLIGRQVGRYQIVEVLGRGGMAAVYRARDTALRRDVALKILYPQYTSDPAQVERFQREAVLAAGLDHPGIVPIYDVGEADGLVYIAMRLLGGISFAEVLRLRGSLPVVELLPIVDQIASALDYAHARQIVHRDIKPANILVEGEDGANPTLSLAGAHAVLTDFGIAKSLDPGASGLTATGMLIGTPDYMAPEQIRGGRTVDSRADVYALGILVYRALTGRRPFEGSTEEVLLGHLQGTAAQPSAIDPRLTPALGSAILRAIARDPNQRYATAGDFARALRSAAGLALPITPRPALRDTTGSGARRGNSIGPRTSGSPTINAQPTRQGVAAPPYSARANGATSAQYTREGVAAPPYARPDQTTSRERSGGAGSKLGFVLLGMLLALVIGGGMIYAAGLLANRRDSGGVVGAIASPTPSLTPATAQPSATAQPTATEQPSAAPSPTGQPTAAAQPTTAPTATARPRATATSKPLPKPTLAPSATPTAPLPTPTTEPTPADTPTSTPSPTPCAVQPASQFTALLESQGDVAAALGCATEAGQSRPIAEQNFERGAMIWVAGQTGRNGTIYTVFDNETGDPPTWQVFEDTWQEGDPADSGDQTPPPGRYEPLRGFGKLWYAHEDIASALGWAKEEKETGATGVLQRFTNGRLLYSDHGFGKGPSIYVMLQNGTFTMYKAT